MRADFRKIDALSQRLVERARHAERIIVQDAARHRIRSGPFAKLKWLKTSGIITPENGATFPVAKFSRHR